MHPIQPLHGGIIGQQQRHRTMRPCFKQCGMGGAAR
jgi:hypothetical protein